MMPFLFLARRAVRAVPWSIRSHIKELPFISKLQRWFVSTQLSGQSFVHEADAGPAKGIRFQISLPEDKGIWTGLYEKDFSRYVAECVRPGMVGYDVGAWHGFFSGIMLARGAREVVLFEPLPENVAVLKAFARLNPTHRISVQQVALGDQRSTMKLLQMPGSSMAKLEVSPFQKERVSTSRVDVLVMPLDAYIQEQKLPGPELIKIDIEGAELMMLRGAERALTEFHPVILAEIHSGELFKDVSQFLQALDYSLEVLRTSDTNLRESDAIQIRARYCSVRHKNVGK